jgi:hypothetical protein
LHFWNLRLAKFEVISQTVLGEGLQPSVWPRRMLFLAQDGGCQPPLSAWLNSEI